MSMKVIGIQTDAKFTIDGKEFRGCNLFLSYPSSGVTGVKTEKVYVDNSKACYVDALNLKVDDEVNFLYNRYGKVDAIVKL